MNTDPKHRTGTVTPLVAAAVTVSLLVAGCNTDWQPKSTEYRTQSTRNRTLPTGTETVRSRSYEFSDVRIGSDGVHRATVSETISEITYGRLTSVREDVLEEVVHEQKRTYKYGMPAGVGLAVGAGVALIPYIFPGDDEEDSNYYYGDEEDEEEARARSALLGGLGAFAASFVLMVVVSGDTDTRTRKTGRTRTGDSEELRSWRGEKQGERVVSSGAASGVRVRIGSMVATSNSDGEIRVPVERDDWAPTVDGLRELIGRSQYARQIASAYREAVLAGVLERSTRHSVTVSAASLAEPRNSTETVHNASTRLNLSGYRVTEQDYRAAVRAFVSREINQAIVELRGSVTSGAGAPVAGTELQYQSDAPGKLQLAARYFSGELRTYAAQQIHQYVKGSGAIMVAQGEATVRVWPGTATHLTLLHEQKQIDEGTVQVQRRGGATALTLSGPAGWAPSVSVLQAMLDRSPTVREIRHRHRPAVLESILTNWESHAIVLSIEPRSTTAAHGSDQIKLGGFRVAETQVRDAVGDFVAQQINGNIVEVIFRVLEAGTTIPVPDVEMRYRSLAPSKLQVAGRYFTGGLRREVEQGIGEYLRGEGSIAVPLSGTLTATALANSRLNVEFIQRSYRVVSGAIDITEDSQVTAHMVPTGVITGDANAGRIEQAPL